MAYRHSNNLLRLIFTFSYLTACSLAAASEYHGRITSGGVQVPGVTVTASRGDNESVTVTDQDGTYSFPDLRDGRWTIELAMTGFATIKQEITIAPNMPYGRWELTLLSLDQIRAAAKPILTNDTKGSIPEQRKPAPQSAIAPDNEPPLQDDTAQRASDGLLINGSVNNAATTQFALASAFGNNRNNSKGLYTGGVGLTFDDSALDARPFSLTGLNTPKASYSLITALATLGGPIRIPHLVRDGPTFFVAYQWTRDRNDTTQSTLVPDLLERNGNFSQTLNAAGQPIQIFDPATGLPFPGNIVQITSQARYLLSFYPNPNVAGNTTYNYQVPIIGTMHQDALQSRLNQKLGNKNQVYGTFNFLSSRTGTPNVFNFLDTTDIQGIKTTVNWSYRFRQRLYTNMGFQFSRLSTRETPYFANRENVSSAAGISGNNQDHTNWGPPALNFSSGIAPLSDGLSEFNRNRTDGVGYSLLWNKVRHNITAGGDFRRQEFNYLSQQNPRGTFSFTGSATQGTVNGTTVGGSDFADFLVGVPDTSQIAFGNADKYFRESVYDAYITDDWRVNPALSLNVGMRWEYGSPITELFGRLVSLDVASGFGAVAPVLATDPVGVLTRQRYPSSLIRPDRNGFEPRIGLAWRPLPGSSMVVRAGYGIYDDTSVYLTIANQMSQQAPLSKSLSLQNSASCPLTLANAFMPCKTGTETTFGADPNVRVGYAQNWQISVQRDLPGSLQLTAAYLGIKGTRGMQEFLPNTNPIGAANPCPGCPLGFAFLTSNGNSTRNAGSIQLRRRLRSGFTATLQYTFSKSLDDDAALGGQGTAGTSGATSAGSSTSSSSGSSPNPPAGAAPAAATTQAPLTIAQNWRDLSAERGLSVFDQRHLLNIQLQYTSGMGMGGGTLMDGWRGTLLKEWTVLTQITAGSGLPQTPIYFAAVPGTGFTGTIRPDLTGASIHAGQPGYFLNSAAFSAPRSGQWGNARRDSITGPDQFLLNASLGRTFRLDQRVNLDLRIDSTNFLNHVTYATWNATVNSKQFGLPAAANPMRSLQTTLRVRF